MLQHGSPRQPETSATAPAPPASGGRGGGVAAQHGSLRRQPGVNAGPNTAPRKRAVNDPHRRHGHAFFRPVYGSFRRRRCSARASARVSKATRNVRHCPRPARRRRAGRGSGGSTRVFASTTRRKRRAEHRSAEKGRKRPSPTPQSFSIQARWFLQLIQVGGQFQQFYTRRNELAIDHNIILLEAARSRYAVLFLDGDHLLEQDLGRREPSMAWDLRCSMSVSVPMCLKT